VIKKCAAAVFLTLVLLVSPFAFGCENPILDSDREHWSFQPIKRPKLPKVEQVNWPQTAIDSFILHKLEQRKLMPMPPADRNTLLRRLKFDLLGLPPTPAELLEFEQDDATDAYPRLVDRWLDSPAYGERWAQYWLDLARFAETDGFEHDKVREDAWRYRQWVIDALNQDLPYDQFVGLQLAGDLSERKEDAIATMFCLAGPDMPDINEQDLRRHDMMNEITSTVGAALLGLQLHCAQCHDHKFDPISQDDFFRLRGIFESAVPELKRDRPLGELAAQATAIAPWIYFRGELENRGPACEPRPPRIACSMDSHASFDTASPRRAFVDWLFTAENPLTARVIANRIWQHHFGQSLCENPSDLGVVADEPTHRRLLDWLACELRRNNWSIKQLHRTILLSATYQMASHPMASHPNANATDHQASRQTFALSLKSDPENEFYSRFPRQRLDGEIIRDALLFVSGQLNRDFGGPSVMPPLPVELAETLLPGQWKTSEIPADHNRRSIYVFARRNLRYPIFDAFDRPDAGASCARRDRSTTAIQALQLLNSDLAFTAATNLRDQLLQENSTTSSWNTERLIERLFNITLSRRPTPAEIQKLTTILETDYAEFSNNVLSVCVAVLNSSEFVYVD
jgi:hypothetical protein